MARITVQITTPSNNRITVSPGVSALSSVQLYLNELVDVDTSGGQDGYVLTQQADGSFAMNAIVTRLDGLSDTNIVSPGAGDALVYDDQSGKWVPGGVKSVNGQEGDVVITIPSPPPTPGVSGLADTNITNLQDDQIIRYDSNSGNWLNEDLQALPAGGTTGQALVKVDGTNYNVTWDDIAVDVQYHQRYSTTAETLRSGATETVELYFFAQGDGNGLAESAQSDTATTGYDIRRKLYYAEKAQADPNTTADWTQFTAIADNTTFANAKAALLAYLKERTGGTVPISLKQTWEEVAQAPSFTGLLNETYGSGAAAAYSVRRLNGNYTGAAIQVERSSDNFYQDIGFDSNGDLDESALTTFCTGTTCKVRTWYDQSQTGGTGSGNDAVQTNHTNQPTIYTGGAIVKENGRVAVDFDGSNDSLPLTSSLFQSDANFSIFSIGKHTETTTEGGLYDLGGGSVIVALSFNYQGSNRYGTANYRSGLIGTDGDVYDQRRSLFSHLGTASSNDAFRDSIQGTQNYSAQGNFVNSLGKAKTVFLNGNAQEFVIYNSDKSTDRTSIEENVGDYFTQNTPLLDTYSGAAAAYSLRKLRSAYTGSAIEVYNGTSYQDIGFNVFGELDTVSLAAFCGANNGFVSKWYDQSGNANHATQTNTGSMPKIYDSVTGVVTDSNGNKIAFFDTGSVFENIATFNTSPHTAFAVTQGTGNRTQLYGFGANNAYLHYSLEHWNNVALNSIIGDGSTFTTHSSTASWDSNTHLITSIYNGTDTSLYIDTSLDNTASETKTSSGALSINSRGSRPMYLAELILYTADKSSDRTGIESNINTFYTI